MGRKINEINKDRGDKDENLCVSLVMSPEILWSGKVRLAAFNLTDIRPVPRVDSDMHVHRVFLVESQATLDTLEGDLAVGTLNGLNKLLVLWIVKLLGFLRSAGTPLSDDAWLHVDVFRFEGPGLLELLLLLVRPVLVAVVRSVVVVVISVRAVIFRFRGRLVINEVFEVIVDKLFFSKILVIDIVGRGLGSLGLNAGDRAVQYRVEIRIRNYQGNKLIISIN